MIITEFYEETKAIKTFDSSIDSLFHTCERVIFIEITLLNLRHFSLLTYFSHLDIQTML